MAAKEICYCLCVDCCEATRLRSRLILVAYVTSLDCLRQKPSFGCIAPHLPRFQVIEIETLSIRKNLDHRSGIDRCWKTKLVAIYGIGLLILWERGEGGGHILHVRVKTTYMRDNQFVATVFVGDCSSHKVKQTVCTQKGANNCWY